MPKSKNTKVSFLFRYFLFNYWADPNKRNMEKCASQLWESRNAFVYFSPQISYCPADLIQWIENFVLFKYYLSWAHCEHIKLCIDLAMQVWTPGCMLCKRSQLYNVETFSTYEIYFRSFFRFFPKLFHFFHPIYFFSNPDKWSVYASAAHFFIIC